MTQRSKSDPSGQSHSLRGFTRAQIRLNIHTIFRNNSKYLAFIYQRNVTFAFITGLCAIHENMTEKYTGLKMIRNDMKNNKDGYTLIELLVVIALLGILAALVVPNVTRFLTSARVAAANAELGVVKTAIVCALIDGKEPPSHDPSSFKFASDVDPSTDWLDVYIQGGKKSLKGTYTVDSSWIMTNAIYPGVTFDTDTGLFH